MYILDRYVLRLFLKVLLVSFLSLTGLYIVFESVGNLDEFIILGKRQGSYLTVMLEHYGPRVLTLFDQMHALLSLLAAMYVVTWLQRTNELVAIQAGGISKGRIVRPLVMATIFVSLLSVANRELAIPRLRSRLVRSLNDWVGTSKAVVVPRHDNETDILISGQSSIALESTVVRPVFRLPPRLHHLGRQLEAEKAVYRRATKQHPAGYLLEQVTRPEAIDSLPSAKGDQRPIVFTRRDFDWLEPGQCFVASGVPFDQLSSGSLWQQFASSRELIHGIRSAGLNYGADARVTVHARLVQPLLDLTLLFLGLPLVVSRNQRGLFVAIGHTALVVSIFVIVVLSSRALGSHFLISPSLAAWLPLIVFVPLATALAPRFWD